MTLESCLAGQLLIFYGSCYHATASLNLNFISSSPHNHPQDCDDQLTSSHSFSPLSSAPKRWYGGVANSLVYRSTLRIVWREKWEKCNEICAITKKISNNYKLWNSSASISKKLALASSRVVCWGRQGLIPNGVQFIFESISNTSTEKHRNLADLAWIHLSAGGWYTAISRNSTLWLTEIGSRGFKLIGGSHSHSHSSRKKSL